MKRIISMFLLIMVVVVMMTGCGKNKKQNIKFNKTTIEELCENNAYVDKQYTGVKLTGIVTDCNFEDNNFDLVSENDPSEYINVSLYVCM